MLPKLGEAPAATRLVKTVHFTLFFSMCLREVGDFCSAEKAFCGNKLFQGTDGLKVINRGF